MRSLWYLVSILTMAISVAAMAQEPVQDQAAVQVAEQVTEQSADPADPIDAEQAAQVAEQTASPADEVAAEDQEDSVEQRQVRRLGDVVGAEEEWSLDIPDLPTVEREPQPTVSLPDPAQDEFLQNLLARRAFAPGDPAIQMELDALLDTVAAQAADALADGNLPMAVQFVNVLTTFNQDRPIMELVRVEVARLDNVATSLANASQALAAGNLVQPDGANAADLYQQVLALDSGNEQALQGLANVHQALLERAATLAEEMNFEAAEDTLSAAAEIHQAPEAVAEARQTIAAFRRQTIAELDAAAVSAIDESRYDDAETAITRLLALGHDRDRVALLETRLGDARLYGSFEPGQMFADSINDFGTPGPQMVVIPAGSFMMGSPDGESDRSTNEGPRHRVTFERGFALSRTEITVGEFAIFVESTGFQTDAERTGQSRVYDPRSGRMSSRNGVNWREDYTGSRADANLPVVHVSWNDASAYARWLAEQTGRGYRLPSEAEFEFALRAGTQSMYWWGDGSPGDEATENLTGDRDTSPTNAQWNVAFRRYDDGYWGPAPVGRLMANPFGLYDMGGNVMEWVEDCWHDSFVRAPDDGSAWVNPGCNRRVLRGGAWSSTPAMSRSAYRLSGAPDSTDMRVGFRVARDL